MRNKSIAVLAYTLFLLTTAALFIRPTDIFLIAAGWPIYETLILSTLALTLQSVQGHFHWYYLRRQPISLCVLGVFGAVTVSHLQHVYFGGAVEGGILVLKILVYYALLLTVINSPT